MKALRTTLATGLATLATLCAHAAELKLPGWYAAASIGGSDYRQVDEGLDGAFANQGFATTTSVSRHDTGGTLDIGYRFNQWFAVEGGYVNFGRFDYASQVSAPALDVIGGSVKSGGARLTAVGIVPLQYGFAAFGKADVYDLRTRLEGQTGSGVDVGDSHSRAGGTFGAGASYDITKDLSARVEWNRFVHANDSDVTGKADIDLMTVGVAYRF